MNAKRPKWFKSFLVKYRRSVIFALVLGLAASGCAALLMFTSGYLISATAIPGISLFTIMVPVACVQLFGFGRPAARYLERLISHDWVLKITSDLRRMLYWGIERRAGDPERKRAAGEYLGLLSDDVAHLQNLYLRVIFPTAVAILLAIGASIMFGVFSIPFALLMVLIFVLVVAVLPNVALLATRAQTVYAKSLRAQEYTSLTDDVLGAADWVLADRGDDAVDAHMKASITLREIELKLRTRQRVLSLVGTIVLGLAVCAVVVWSSGRFGSTGMNMSAGFIAAFVLGFFPLIEAFSVLPAAVSQAPVHEESIVRLDEYVSDKPQTSPTPEILESGHCGQGALVFDHVCYTYPDASKPALNGLTLTVDAGSSIALLGRSGSGKSTFAEIARGALTPTSGTVDVGGTIGFLGQVPYLFNRSLRENLTLGVLDASDDKLIQTLENVGLGEKFESLENGLDTIVGETGVGFSGGEAHRIALARALAADTAIVLVDEPFAALDPITETQLLDTLFTTCEGRTLVVITHHLAQIERFDRVVFIEDGRLDLDGSPAELMEASDRFRKLVEFDR